MTGNTTSIKSLLLAVYFVNTFDVCVQLKVSKLESYALLLWNIVGTHFYQLHVFAYLLHYYKSVWFIKPLFDV